MVLFTLQSLNTLLEYFCDLLNVYDLFEIIIRGIYCFLLNFTSDIFPKKIFLIRLSYKFHIMHLVTFYFLKNKSLMMCPGLL